METFITDRAFRDHLAQQKSPSMFIVFHDQHTHINNRYCHMLRRHYRDVKYATGNQARHRTHEVEENGERSPLGPRTHKKTTAMIQI